MTQPKRVKLGEEVSASFFRGGLEFTVETRVNDPRYGLQTTTSKWEVWASRRAIERALRALGFVKTKESKAS